MKRQHPPVGMPLDFLIIFRLRDQNCSKTLKPVTYRVFCFLPLFKIDKKKLKEEFEVLKFIANGSFGDVYEVIDKKTGEQFALKILKKAKIFNEDFAEQLKDETTIQTIISHHPFIVTSHCHWQDKGQIYLCELNVLKFDFR